MIQQPFKISSTFSHRVAEMVHVSPSLGSRVWLRYWRRMEIPVAITVKSDCIGWKNEVVQVTWVPIGQNGSGSSGAKCSKYVVHGQRKLNKCQQFATVVKGGGRAGEKGGANHQRPQAAQSAHVHRCPSHSLIPKWPHIDKIQVVNKPNMSHSDCIMLYSPSRLRGVNEPNISR